MVVATMDRSTDLRRSLPNWLAQDYPNWSLTVLDYSSKDGIARALAGHSGPRLSLVTLPRLEYWSHARAGNGSLRYAPPSDLVFVLSTDTEFRDARHLSEIVAAYLEARHADGAWFARWRLDEMKFDPLAAPTPPPAMQLDYPRVYCHTFGGIVLVEREALLALGGYNEFLTGWGYEDTDLLTRLELCGFARIAIDGMTLHETTERKRTANLQTKDRDVTWTHNRLLSDRFISTVGLVPPLPWHPGREAWVEIDGVRHEGWSAPQQRLPRNRSMRFGALHAFFAYRDGLIGPTSDSA
jgi:hypothetical protein